MKPGQGPGLETTLGPRTKPLRSELKTRLFYITLTLFTAIGIALLFVPFRLGLRFGQGGQMDRVHFELYVGRFSVARSEYPFTRALRARKKLQRRLLHLPRSARRVVSRLMRGALRSLLRRSGLPFRRIEEFQWKTVIGADDAALTSWLVGGVWGAKSILMAHLAGRHTFGSVPRVEVIPDYQGLRLALELSCIFSFTFGEIILATLPKLRSVRRG